MTEKKVITISLPASEHGSIKQKATDQKRSMSSVVREACAWYCNPSVTIKEIKSHLDGRETPADLQAILDGQNS